MISFCQPCLQFKIIAAVKLQYGFPGLITTSNRYLSRTSTCTVIGGPYAGTFTQTDSIDPSSGDVTTSGSWIPNDGLGDSNNFGMGIDYPYPNGGGTTTISGDGGLVNTVTQSFSPFATITLTVSLSDPYTTSALDADADDIISSVDIDAMPWNSMVFGDGDEQDGNLYDYMPTGFLSEMFPSYTYGVNNPFTTPAMQSGLQGAAWSGYAYGIVGTDLRGPNCLYKAKGIVQMAGNYSLKTYPINYNPITGAPTTGAPTCSTGTIGCGGATVTVPAPALSHNPTHYVIFTPGGTCP